MLISDSVPESLASLRGLYEWAKEGAAVATGEELAKRALEQLGCEQNLVGLQVNGTRWSRLATHFTALYDYLETGDRAKAQRDVVVVGAGPIGLLHALEAKALGARVTVVEKRTSFTRNVWFDLGPEAWFDTISHLKQIGLFWISFEHVTQYSDDSGDENLQVITMRCQELQRMLAKVAFVAGIEFKFGFAYSGTKQLEDGTNKLTAIIEPTQTSIGENQDIPFDLMIGSDGANSQVRKSVFFAYQTHNSFLIDSRLPMRIFDLNQPTLLMNFKAGEDGKCRATKNSVPGSSFEIGASMPGVTHVFKRFYLGRCHLQLLFTQAFAKENFAENLNSEIAWPKILEIVNAIFTKPFESVEDLKAHIVAAEPSKNANSLSEDGEESSQDGLDVQYFKIEIRRTNHALFRPHLGEEKHPNSLVAIVGDASITAHYRLGVGINNGIRQISAVTRKALLLEDWNDDDAIEEIDYAELQQLTTLANFEALLIASESFCDYVVTFDITKPLYSHAVYLRDRAKWKQGEPTRLVKMEGMDLLTNCEALSG